MKKIFTLRFAIIRYLLTAILIMPFMVFYKTPSLKTELCISDIAQEGKVNVYRSDDAVGYYFRATFTVTPDTGRAYMDGVYENLRSFRMRFIDMPAMTVDSLHFYVNGVEVYSLTGKEMSELVNKTSYLDIEAVGDSMRIETRADGAYFILEEQTYMTAFAWLIYLLGIFFNALIAAAPLTLAAYLFGVKRPISEILFLMTPAFAIVFGELACGSISAIDTEYFLLNYFALLGVQVVLRFLTTASFSSGISGAVFCIVYLVNHFVNLFRGRPLLPWDLQAAGTAAQVAGAYEFEFSARLILLILAAIFTAVFPQILKLSVFKRVDSFKSCSPLVKAADKLFGYKSQESVSSIGENRLADSARTNSTFDTNERQRKPGRRKSRPGLKERIANINKKNLAFRLALRAAGAAVGVVIIMLAFKSETYELLEAESWDASIIIDYQSQGMPMTFMKFADIYRVSEPEGYSDEIIAQIYDEYSDESLNGKKYFLPEDAEITTKPKTLIVVMNESLSELSYKNEEAVIDTLPFFYSLTDNTIRGTLYVSVRGGGTCNTEFESLTANAMAFLPPNTYPFSAYVKKNIASLASYMSGLGYDSASLHLADRKNWKRSTVYPMLGLTPFYAYDDYSSVDLLRGYATDEYDYTQLKLLESYMDGDEKFIFNVTIQNHGGYSLTDDMNVTVDLSQYGSFSTAEVYYSLVKLSDEAIEDLIHYYSNSLDDTMIVIYGDHQPSLGEKADDFIFGEDSDVMEKYETPFVIWANYELPEVTVEKMSANYMSALVLEAAGMELTPFLKAAAACYSEYPVITSYGVIDKDGQYFTSVDAVPDETGVLYKYRCAQYNNMFDSNRLDELFSLGDKGT